MSNNLSKDFGLIEGQTYIIGREGGVYVEGFIYINSSSVSRRHVSMKVKNGRIYLRDLDSTNGTYLIENDCLLVPFKEGYVTPSQPLAIGKVKCTINSLIAIAGVNSTSKHTPSDSDETQLFPQTN